MTLPGPPAPPVRDRRPADMDSELKMAAAICVRTKTAVVSMFSEARMGRAVDSASAVSLVEEISDSVARNPGALISLARLKTADDYTYMHSVAVCALMVALGRQLKLNDEQTRLAGMAGLLHDLGKAAIPMSVLNKPGKLTDKEFTVVRSHPVEGYHLLKAGGKVPDAVLDAWENRRDVVERVRMRVLVNHTHPLRLHHRNRIPPLDDCTSGTHLDSRPYVVEKPIVDAVQLGPQVLELTFGQAGTAVGPI